MNSNRLNSALLVAIAASLALSACDRGDDAYGDAAMTPPPAATEPTPDALPPPAGEPVAIVTVTTVDLGNEVGSDNRVTAPMSAFATGDTIHASVATAGSGGTVTTRWTFEDGQVVNTEDKIVPAGDQITDFTVTNPAGWPAGGYTLEIMVDGEVTQTRTFTVE